MGGPQGGADKALLPLAGRPLIAHAVARLDPQVEALAISANGDPARFAAFGLPIVADSVEGFAGPLAGVATFLAILLHKPLDAAIIAALMTEAGASRGQRLAAIIAYALVVPLGAISFLMSLPLFGGQFVFKANDAIVEHLRGLTVTIDTSPPAAPAADLAITSDSVMLRTRVATA